MTAELITLDEVQDLVELETIDAPSDAKDFVEGFAIGLGVVVGIAALFGC